MWVVKTMGNKAEQFSRGTIESGGTPRWRHSTNQRMLKVTRDRQGKDFSPMDNTVNDASRRERIKLSQGEFEKKALFAETQRRMYYEGLSQDTTLQHDGMPEVVEEEIGSDYIDPNENIKKEVTTRERQEDIAIADFNDGDKKVGNISLLPTRIARTILSFFSNQG